MDELVIYVWEGQADIAERVERCVVNLGVSVIRADGMSLPVDNSELGQAIAVVSVSVLEGARFTRQSPRRNHAVVKIRRHPAHRLGASGVTAPCGIALHARCYEVELEEEDAVLSGFQRVLIDDLHKFPVSRLISRFFSLLLKPNYKK